MYEFEHQNSIVNYNRADYSELRFSDQDVQVLKELARQVREIAERPEHEKKRLLWKAHNGLEETQPIILCDPENGWNELIPQDQTVCVNSIARHWEQTLRKQIFWGNEMGDDYVVEPYFDVRFVHRETPWTLKGNAKQVTDKVYDKEGGAYHIDSVLDDYHTQLDKIIYPELIIDYPLTDQLMDIAQTVFKDILEVRKRGWWFWSVGLTDEAVFLRGMDKLFMDFYDQPEKIHVMMELLFQHTMKRLDFLEDRSLLNLNNDESFVGSGGMGYTRELPSSDFDGRVRTRDMWGLAESQVTVGVSPDMFREFIFPYQKKLMERFGLTCYGCCEQLDDRFDIVKEVKNLRRVSVSAWADKRLMAEKLGKAYIYSVKPQPAFIAGSTIDADSVTQEIRDILQAAEGTRLEIIMKDNHTLGNNPENIKEWVRIARKEISAME